jgi:hypothetical protein
MFDSPPTLASVEDDLVRERTAVLRRLAVDETADATRKSCRGPLAIVSPDYVNLSDVPCPKHKHTTLAIALPRPGGARTPFGGPNDEAKSPAFSDAWATRVIANSFSGPTEFGSEWVVTSVYDVVVRRDRQGWKLVKRVLITIIE